MPVAITDTVNTIIQSVLTRSRKKLIRAIAKSHALYSWASATGRVEFEDGGYELTNPLIVGSNPNITSYRYYDVLPINQTDEFATLKFYWSRVAGSLMISEQEIDENQGSAKIFDLVAKKMDVLEESIKEKFGVYLYGAGAGTDPNGLALLVPADPTAGTVGSISQVSNFWNRTSSYDFAGTLDATNIEQGWDDIKMDLTVNGERPDVIICGRNQYRSYKQAIRDKFTIPLQNGGKAGESMYDLDFEGVMFGKIPVIFDEDCDPTLSYWLNSKYLRLHILRDVNWRIKNLVAPWNQDVVGKRVVWQGNWCRWKAWRTHAVVND